MIRIVFFIATITFSVFVNAQSNYEKNMKTALEFFNEKKLDEASALFERISETESENWLPNYYVALSNTLQSFGVSDKKQKEVFLEKAEKFLKKASENQNENVEIMIVQAYIDTAWIIYDPMVYGQQNTNKIFQIYTKAKLISPKNPRVFLASVDFEMNSAKYMGGNPKDFCDDVKKATELFATFKPESEFYPNWGVKRVQELTEFCNK